MKEKFKTFFKKTWNIIKKIFKAIGKFFKVIFNYIKDNFWIQPILIVVIIFGLVFGIQGIVKGIENIKIKNEAKKGFVEEEDYFIRLTWDELKKKLNDKEDFVFLISQDGCSACATHFDAINQYIKDTDNMIYELNITKSTTDTSFYKDVSLTENDVDEIRERLNDILHRDNLLESGSGLLTPTTILVKSGEFVDAKVGAVKGNEGFDEYDDFIDFINGNQIP